MVTSCSEGGSEYARTWSKSASNPLKMRQAWGFSHPALAPDSQLSFQPSSPRKRSFNGVLNVSYHYSPMNASGIVICLFP